MQPRARWSGILVADIVQERLKATQGFLIDVFLFRVMCEEVWMHPQEKFAECLLQERMRSAISIGLMPPPGGPTLHAFARRAAEQWKWPERSLLTADMHTPTQEKGEGRGGLGGG